VIKYFFIISTVLFSFSAKSQQKLTYEMAIATALENNYGIKIAENNKSIADNNVTYGNAGFLPILSANANRTYGSSSFERQLASGTEQSIDNAKSERTSIGADLNWTIFDGLRMFRNLNQLSELNNQSVSDLRMQVELIIFQVSIAYYQAALEKERLQLSDSNIRFSEERLRIAKDRYELGDASKLEYLQAQVDLNADKSAKIRQNEVLQSRKLELLRLMATGSDTIAFELEYQLNNDTSLELADLLNSMETGNPELLSLRYDQSIAMYEEEITKGEQMPTVDLFASYVHSESESPAGFAVQSTSDDITYGLSANWTLFNGFNVRRRIQNVKIQKDNANLAYQNRLLELKTNVQSRYINYANNINLIDLESENIKVAEENNEIAKDRYEIGLSNPLELREAQVNLINAELREKDAAFAAKLAEIELLYLSGQLSIN